MPVYLKNKFVDVLLAFVTLFCLGELAIRLTHR